MKIYVGLRRPLCVCNANQPAFLEEDLPGRLGGGKGRCRGEGGKGAVKETGGADTEGLRKVWWDQGIGRQRGIGRGKWRG